MKLTIERSALLNSLGHVQSVVERRNTIPILSNVQIEATDGTVGFTATDLDLAIFQRVGAEIATAGVAPEPPHTLFDIVRKLPDGAQIELELSGEDGRLALRTGRSEFTLSCLPKEDFPVMAEGDMSHHFTVSAVRIRAWMLMRQRSLIASVTATSAAA